MQMPISAVVNQSGENCQNNTRRYGCGSFVDSRSGKQKEVLGETETGRLLLTCNDRMELHHIYLQLMGIGSVLLNQEVALPILPRFADLRYQVQILKSNGDESYVCIIDQTPPSATEGGFMSVNLLYSGTAGIPGALNMQAISAAMVIADGLNRMGYDWNICTLQQYQNRVNLPAPDWTLTQPSV